MRPFFRSFAGLAALLLAHAACPAQVREGASERLDAALAKMAALPSLRYEMHDETPNVQTVFGAAGGDVDTRGLLGDGLLRVRFGEEEVILAGGRMVAREGDGEHRLRHERRADGASLPFLLRPPSFFAGLRQMKLELARADVGTLDDRPVEVFSVTVDGANAYELVHAGLVPTPQATAFQIIHGGVKPAEPPMTIDLALFVDPATHLLHAIEVRGYQRQPDPPGRGGGFRNVDEVRGARDQPAAAEEPTALPYEDGLPVRDGKAGKRALCFRAVFTEHGRAPAPELSARARALLGR